MKKRMILWFMVLTLLLPLVSASTFASRTEIYDEYIEPMSDYDHFYLAKSDYGEMSFVLDTRNEVLGIATGFYPMSLTGQETKETLKAIAKELIEDGTPLLLAAINISQFPITRICSPFPLTAKDLRPAPICSLPICIASN